MEAYLQHLDVSNREIQIRSVAEDERSAEEKTDGENRPEEHILGDMYVFCSIYQVRCTLEHPCPYGLMK